jgi:hypothetical protein
MVFVVGNVLRIQLPKYHNGDEPLSPIQQLTKVCVANNENIDLHNISIFLWYLCYFDIIFHKCLIFISQGPMLYLFFLLFLLWTSIISSYSCSFIGNIKL